MYKQCRTEATAARQRQITDSLLDLMMDRPYDLISVTDICKQCCLSRNSFYQYFTGKDAVLQALIDYALMDFDLHAISSSMIPPEAYQKELARVFSYWLQRKPLLGALKLSGKSAMLIQQAVDYTCKIKLFSSSLHTQQDYLQSYANAFVASGTMTMLVQWHSDGFPGSTEEMAALTMQLLSEPIYSSSMKKSCSIQK